MIFTAPWALLGLVAAALPILLHLVQRREPPEVAFPAVRYLEDATRDHRQRLKLRHWLLLVVRTLLIVALVLAAAGPRLAGGGIGGHAPSALVLVVDNSASSAVVVDGEPLLARLIAEAEAVLARATPADRLWLLTADGRARPGTADELRTRLAALVVDPARLDLGAAVATGRGLIAGAGRPGEVVVITDLQRSALGEGRGDAPVLVLRPEAAAPLNRRVATLDAGAQPWGPEGGRVSVAIAASDTQPVPVALAAAGRGARDVLLTPGVPALQRAGPLAPGWTRYTATLPPDEFRLDDERSVALRVAPPAVVRWDPEARYVAAALAVLAADGRVVAGEGVRLDGIGPGASVVLPPEDPARLGALNRALAARGAAWRYGVPVAQGERSDSGGLLPQRETILRRVRLERTGATGDVLLTVAGEPWLVRSGDLLLLGSRLDPAWSTLPVSAAFVPFLDALLTRAARGEPVTPDLVAGAVWAVPERVTRIADGRTEQAVEGGMLWRPRTTGIHHLLAGADTVGAVAVHLDPRESDLVRAAPGDVRALWRRTTVAALGDGGGLAFTSGGRGDLRGPLLWLALLLVLTEGVLAGRLRGAPR